MRGADGNENIPHREWLVVFERVINEVKMEMAQRGRPNDFIGAKVSFLFQKRSLSLKESVDYIQYTSIRYARRVGLVFGGLYFFKEGIPASDSWLVFSAR